MGAQQRKEVNEHNERIEKFNKYITPHLDYINRLVTMYSFDRSNIDDYYGDVLENFFKYIHTYDPKKSIMTWIHIVVRRFVQESVRRQELNMTEDVCVDSIGNSIEDQCDTTYCALTPANYKEFVNDDIYEAVESLRSIYKEAFLMQVAGFSLSEITKILHQEGKLKTPNIDTVKSRVFLAKSQLRTMITRDGQKRADN